MNQGSQEPSASEPLRGTGLGLFVIAAILWLPAASNWVSLPLTDLVQRVPDDAFYYLKIAQNIATTGQSSADGFSTTNGYHPLWMLYVSGLARIIGDNSVLLRSALATCLVLHFVTAVVVGLLIASLVGNRWGWTAATCWLVNPLANTIASQALETALYLLMLVVALMVYLKASESISKRNTWYRYSDTFRIGLVLGLVCLARTEGAIVAILVSLALGSTNLRRGVPPRGTIAALGWLWLGVSLPVLPWVLFSLVAVGTPIQDSLVMKTLWYSDQYPGLRGRLRGLVDSGRFFFPHTVRLMSGAALPREAIAVVSLVVSVLAWKGVGSSALPRARKALLAVVATSFALMAPYLLGLADRQVWWLGVPCLGLFLVTVISVGLVDATTRRSRRDSRIGQVVLTGGALAAAAYWFVTFSPAYPWQRDVLESQPLVEQLIPAPARIGCFNAGIPLFFGSGRVIAIDGLVSHNAMRRWSSLQFDTLLVEAQVMYIADEEAAFDRAKRFSSRQIGATEVASYPLTQWPTGRRVLWKISVPLRTERF